MYKKTNILRVLILFAVLNFPAILFSQDSIDEDALFSDEESITASDSLEDSSITDVIEKQSLSFTGSLNSRNSYSMSRDWIFREPEGYDQNLFSSYFQGNFYLDARLRSDVKGFISLSANYYPAGLIETKEVNATVAGQPVTGYVTDETYTKLSAKEMFVDFNLKRRLYLRIGKQTLKWGTGYMWNPSDLVNVEKKDLFDAAQVMEGVYGAKISIPFGTIINFNTFVNMNDSGKVDEFSLSPKIEFLIGNTEMSVSAFLKKEHETVYGFDFTTRLFSFDIRGEASASNGDIYDRLDYSDPLNPGIYRRNDEWIFSASFGFGRSFDFLDVNDRIMVNAEFYYNGRGYKDDILAMREKTITVNADELIPYPYTTSMAEYFLANNLYTANNYGMYYAGLSLMFSRLGTKDLSTTLMYMQNLVDRSMIVMNSYSYAFEYNVTLSLTLSGFIGNVNREYTMSILPGSSGNAGSAEFLFGIVF